MITGTIYCAFDTTNGKVYIGKTIRGIEIRRNGHLYDVFCRNSKTHFHRALRMHSEKFEWKILFKGLCTHKELNEAEKYWISFFNSFNRSFGYNLTTGGDGGILSEETKQKMSKAHTGKIFSEQHRINIGKAQKIAQNRPEVKAKVIAKQKGRKLPEEHKVKLRAAKLGKKRGQYSKEHCANISRGLTGRKLSEEHKAKISAGHKRNKETLC